MATKLSSAMLVFVCTLLVSSAQVFYKLGANKLEFNLIKIITNYNLIAGMAIYAVGAVILLVALRGGELSVLYPIIATSYIWVTLLSIYFFNEVMNFYKLAGIAAIISGIILIGLGSKKHTSMEYTKAI